MPGGGDSVSFFDPGISRGEPVKLIPALLLRLEFCCTPCQNVVIVPDTSYITSAIRKLMLDIPSPGSFQNIGL